MSVTSLTTAERIAAAICWLARQQAKTPGTTPAPIPRLGLPEVPGLRFEVHDRHGDYCDWCDYPLEKLVELCDLHETRDGHRTEDSPADYDIFGRYPAKQQRDLVLKALHGEQR